MTAICSGICYGLLNRNMRPNRAEQKTTSILDCPRFLPYNRFKTRKSKGFILIGFNKSHVMEAKDFIGLAIWAVITTILGLLNRKYKKMTNGDFVFLSLVILISIELAWLKYGY